MDITREWIEQRGEREPDYLGDGVYASIDKGGQIWLRTPRSEGIHEIALDFYTFEALVRYQKRISQLTPASPSPAPA